MEGNDVIQHSTVIQTSATKLARVEVKSRQEPEMVFSNLGHIIDELLLRECFNSLDGSKAVGIDGVTKASYGKGLNENLPSLLTKIRKGTYIPKPSRVVEIPKLDGTTRPLAIACTEDKIVQEACKRILERIFEPIFLPVSFGFRPGSNQHKALVALRGNLNSPNNGAVLDVDLRKAFDTIPHNHLEEMLGRKIADKRFLYLLMKLIKAEVVGKSGKIEKNICGVPQGSILSPLLCNVFLHYVVDTWFEEVNETMFFKRCTLVRFADDKVLTAPNMVAAKQLQELLRKRLELFGMQLHEGKTRVLLNGRAAAKASALGGAKVEGFTFLGFLHVWGVSRNRKEDKMFWRIKLRTCPKRFRAKLSAITENIKKQRHNKQLVEKMKAVVRGYLNYFAINDNMKRVQMFVSMVHRILYKWLNRRSQKRSMNWEAFQQMLNKANFPKAKLQHNLFFTTSAFAKERCM